MKILVLAPHPYYIDRGTPIDVDILVRALCEEGHEVDLVAYSSGEDRSYPRLTIHRAKTPNWLHDIGPGFSLRKVLADLWLLGRAWGLVRCNRYDVIHAGEEAVFFAMWFKLLYRIQFVYDMDSSIAQQMVEKLPWLKPLAWFFNWCEACAIRSALAVSPVCNALCDLARQHGAQHITTLHDISQMTADQFQTTESIRETLGLKGLVIMYVGNLESYQGIDLLLNAFPKVLQHDVDIDLVIAGGSPGDIHRYKQNAAQLGIDKRTHFIGHWPATRLGELLCQADILTAPRIKGINTPMKVFPYLHSGRAVLVTDLPTHTQILSGDVAELAPADPDGFAASIVALARDPERRRRLGEAGQRFVEENHTYSAHKRRVADLYNHVQGELDTADTVPDRAAG